MMNRIVLLFVINFTIAYGQSTEGPPPVPNRDSVFAEREVTSSDSLASPLLSFGSLISLLPNDTNGLSTLSITKYDRREVRYQTMGELLSRATPFMPLSQGGFGQHDAISVLGGTNSDLSVSVNGRALFEPWSQQFNLSQASPEAYEKIEILTGVQAIGLGATMSLSAVNMQEMQHNTSTPFTQLWYGQGGGDFIGTDVSFSQNVAPGLNVSLGVRRTGANGRYTGTGFDVWNARIAVRYTMDSMNHFGLSYGLASHNTELWGGLRTLFPLNQFSEETVQTVFSTLKDESRRHDVTLSGVHLFNESHQLSVQGYVSTVNMLRIRDSTIFTSSSDTLEQLKFKSRLYGALVRSKHQLGWATLNLGAGIDIIRLDSTVYNQKVNDYRPQVFAHLSVPVYQFELLAAGRSTLVNDIYLFGGGVGLSWKSDGISAIADASTIQRAPSPTEGLSLRPERQTVISFSLESRTAMFDVGLLTFYRTVESTLVTVADRDSLQFIRRTTTSNGPNQSLAGATFFATIRTGTIIDEKGIGTGQGWWLEFKPMIRSFYDKDATDSTRRFPLFFGELTASFVYQTGPNSIHLGIKGSLISPMASIQYVPLSWTYTAPADVQGWAANGVDAFLQATLGNASVRLAYENIFAQRWYTTAVAPYIIRDIRFSVTWSFFD